PASWLGRPFWDLWKTLRERHAHPEEEERLWTALLDEPESVRVEDVTLVSPQERILERFSGPIKGAGSENVGRICLFRDVTARRRAESDLRSFHEEALRAREELEKVEEELRLANEGLEKRMAEMQRLNKDLKALDQMKSNLLANVSHELQTPLVSIKGFTEMILMGRLGGVTQEQEKGLEVALRNINRLIEMINSLLAFARTEGPATALRLETFPLGAVIEETVELMREKASARGITLRVAVPPGDLLVRADRDKITQVFVNLVSNAVRYNKDGGDVSVQAQKGRGDLARVEVRDTGIGIARADLDRIFDRYYQAGQSPARSEGTGIGLSIARNILRQHGCVIRVESEEGRGSVFSFTLPLAPKARGVTSARSDASSAQKEPDHETPLVGTGPEES
ncbi:MAG TPA: ATP-binding protein, partial [Candidatus Polarisedimenticolia bacterium]|nr:ATP-binding protein [Candidatus Polarisedimenticolia bacterium]